MAQIKLRSLIQKDVSAFYNIVTQKAVAQAAQIEVISDVTAAQKLLEQLLNNGNVLGIEVNNQLVGIITWSNKITATGAPDFLNWELNYFLSEQWWNQQVMTLALKLFLNRVWRQHPELILWAEVRPDNLASSRVLVKLGFELFEHNFDDYHHQVIDMYRYQVK